MGFRHPPVPEDLSKGTVTGRRQSLLLAFVGQEVALTLRAWCLRVHDGVAGFWARGARDSAVSLAVASHAAKGVA